MVGPRLRDMLSGLRLPENEVTSDPESIDDHLERLHHFTTPSMPHLLALLTHQSLSSPPTETSLIVIDSFSTLFALAYPKTGENVSSQQPAVKKSDAAQWASGRRWAAMGDIISQISRLATTWNIAILLTSQMATRITSEAGAVLQPAISGTAWDTGISSRVVVFRDWIFQATDAASSQGEYVPGVRLAGVSKAKGVSYEDMTKTVMFTIEKVSALDCCGKASLKEKTGLREIRIDQTETRLNETSVQPALSLKRKRGEIVDSQSEDEETESDREFGWVGEDDTLNTKVVPE